MLQRLLTPSSRRNKGHLSQCSHICQNEQAISLASLGQEPIAFLYAFPSVRGGILIIQKSSLFVCVLIMQVSFSSVRIGEAYNNNTCLWNANPSKCYAHKHALLLLLLLCYYVSYGKSFALMCRYMQEEYFFLVEILLLPLHLPQSPLALSTFEGI